MKSEVKDLLLFVGSVSIACCNRLASRHQVNVVRGIRLCFAQCAVGGLFFAIVWWIEALFAAFAKTTPPLASRPPATKHHSDWIDCDPDVQSFSNTRLKQSSTSASLTVWRSATPELQRRTAGSNRQTPLRESWRRVLFGGVVKHVKKMRQLADLLVRMKKNFDSSKFFFTALCQNPWVLMAIRTAVTDRSTGELLIATLCFVAHHAGITEIIHGRRTR